MYMIIQMNYTIFGGTIKMRLFEVIYAEIIEAEDFFDAVEKSKKIGREVISVSEAPVEDDDDVFN